MDDYIWKSYLESHNNLPLSDEVCEQETDAAKTGSGHLPQKKQTIPPPQKKIRQPHYNIRMFYSEA